MISVFRNVMDTSDSKCRYKIWFRRVGAIMYVSLNGSVNKFYSIFLIPCIYLISYQLSPLLCILMSIQLYI